MKVPKLPSRGELIRAARMQGVRDAIQDQERHVPFTRNSIDYGVAAHAYVWTNPAYWYHAERARQMLYRQMQISSLTTYLKESVYERPRR